VAVRTPFGDKKFILVVLRAAMLSVLTRCMVIMSVIDPQST